MKRSVIAAYAAVMVITPVATVILSFVLLVVVFLLAKPWVVNRSPWEVPIVLGVIVIGVTLGSGLATLGARMIERRFRRSEDAKATISTVEAFS